MYYRQKGSLNRVSLPNLLQLSHDPCVTLKMLLFLGFSAPESNKVPKRSLTYLFLALEWQAWEQQRRYETVVRVLLFLKHNPSLEAEFTHVP